VFNAEGQPETVKYQDLAPLLLNELQKLKAEKQLEVTSLRDENAAMKQRLAEMEEREQARAERMAKLEQLILDASKPAAAAAVNTNAD
jgi:Tfp pilus assembly protein PilN